MQNKRLEKEVKTELTGRSPHWAVVSSNNNNNKRRREEEENVVNSEELTGITEYLTFCTRCRYNWARWCIESCIFILVSFCE
jgi:hypothetical protein